MKPRGMGRVTRQIPGAHTSGRACSTMHRCPSPLASAAPPRTKVYSGRPVQSRERTPYTPCSAMRDGSGANGYAQRTGTTVRVSEQDGVVYWTVENPVPIGEPSTRLAWELIEGCAEVETRDVPPVAVGLV